MWSFLSPCGSRLHPHSCSCLSSSWSCNVTSRLLRIVAVSASALAALAGIILLVLFTSPIKIGDRGGGGGGGESSPGTVCLITRRASDLVFLVVGDYGRQGNESQMIAARLMDRVAKCMQPEFIISTGDNFYPHGLERANDTQIRITFLDVYDSPNLKNVPWVAVLGNHDYGYPLSADQLQQCTANGLLDRKLEDCDPACCFSPLHQVPEMNPKNLPPRWGLTQGATMSSFPKHGLDIFFIDTNPFIPRYQTAPWAGIIGGISSQDAEKQKQKLDEMLAGSKAPLKIVVGHHPVRSYGEHCIEDPDCQDMGAWLSPLLKKHNVDVYMCGHDHDLQYIKDANDPVHYVVSGAGSDLRGGEFDVPPVLPAGTEFWGAEFPGFVVAVVRNGTMSLHYVIDNLSAAAAAGGEEHPKPARVVEI